MGARLLGDFMTKDSLGDRMKKFYEDRNRTYLARRTPVIIRVDVQATYDSISRVVDKAIAPKEKEKC